MLRSAYASPTPVLHQKPVLKITESLTCVAHLDADLTVTSVNADLCRQFARTSAEACGLLIYDLLHPSARTVLPRHFAGLSAGRRSRFVERVMGRREPDQVFPTRLTGLAVRGEDDALTGFVVLAAPEEWDGEEAVAFSPKPLLTALDAKILEGIATGSSTQQMATRLYLSRQGVEYHVGLMLRRFKAPNRAALISRAYSMGVLTMGAWPPRTVQEFVKRP